MKRLKQFEPLIISAFEERVYHLPMHNHTYFEIIYIVSGKGKHVLDNMEFDYEPSSIFFVSPENKHHFKIEEKTRFVFIKFTDAYFNQNKYLDNQNDFALSPKEMMRYPLLKERVLSFGPDCKLILRNVIENILNYKCNDNLSNSAVIFLQILSIFSLVKENIKHSEGFYLNSAKDNADNILAYIHEKIYTPHALQIKHISEQFHVAENYFSAYFKRTFEISFRNYVNNYRAKLIEKRIISDNLSLKQIAAEFGFTDESHLSRFFRNKFDHSPKEYKIRNRERVKV
ncbi:helix-turn-helix domain-containing protein [Rhizosphaericola mali]|uniref:Helix-turn-helix transcriptional regulator n=1 Tax=Rhizosphaericola mali TaxID=2545455 RepID=A0A5P2G4S0_9BACT|nr:AraC family transcriptional regulator [Rhizosphaericola mali]QES90824.1 helix-turn-helix transcriptional regulator [Rhizosphaericola mali]